MTNEYALDLLMTTIFKMAMPVWQHYKGSVPPEALKKLEVAGDWPSGMSAAAMKRLSQDRKLRDSLLREGAGRMPMKSELLWWCIECRADLTESQMYEFSSGVACENCVRAYYKEQYEGFKKFGGKDATEDELRIRRSNAITWIKRNRRMLEKHAEEKNTRG